MNLMATTTGKALPHAALMLVNPFPPLARVGTSIRTVKFIKHLEPWGWQCIVLHPGVGGTVYPWPAEAYALLKDLPASSEIHEKPSFLRLPARLVNPRLPQDVPQGAVTRPSRSGFRQKMLRFCKHFLIPDEEIFWVFSAFREARRLIQTKNIQVIYTAVPQFSNALLGYWLSRRTGVPLVLDVKDDWIELSRRNGKPAAIVRLEQALESIIARQATRIILTNRQAVDTWRRRYPSLPSQRLALIPNGVDLGEFNRIKKTFKNRVSGKFLMVSAAGGLHPRYRDIQPLLTALANWCQSSPQVRADLRVLFLGSDVYQDYGAYIQSRQLEGVVRSHPVLPRSAYIKLLLSAQVLLLVQMDDAPSSIAGTLYEYWAASGPPILLIGGAGATQSFLVEHGLGKAFTRNQIRETEEFLRSLYNSWRAGKPEKIANLTGLENFDRRQQAEQLLSVFRECMQPGSPGNNVSGYSVTR
jgi:glycosyltransferase involved in cell wall biosynthesis